MSEKQDSSVSETERNNSGQKAGFQCILKDALNNQFVSFLRKKSLKHIQGHIKNVFCV